MAKVTRIAYSHNLNAGKLDQLKEIASRLGNLRTEVWHRYGSISGVGHYSRQIRDEWLAENRQFDVPARLWKETLRDTFDDICLYREAAKVKVRKAISKRTMVGAPSPVSRSGQKDESERKRLFTLLKNDRWTEDRYLRRMMRKNCKHGQTEVDNQIILDTGCYTTFERNGQAWIKVMSLERGKRIAIRLKTNRAPTGTLRLILRDCRVEVHYAVDANQCSIGPCGENVVGIDKGYSEVFVDSEGQVHGDELGAVLSAESDFLKTKYQRRNKLKAIAEAKSKKAQNIFENNLGRKKLNNRKALHRTNVRDKVFKAVHSIADKAKTIVCEDLSSPISSKKKYGKNQNRRLNGWVKGLMQEALNSVSQRRGSSLVLVNCAYTSQMDSRHGVLLGQRSGDSFHCFDGVVLHADQNAARNILARKDDPEIHLWTPFQKVKSILLERTEQFQTRLGLLNQDSSCNEEQLLLFPLSTESESLFN
ncbi:MAG: transposase [Candidatus Poribacteria bacterium]|nr:transposase [Candidatus Poribacteria bacterium]